MVHSLSKGHWIKCQLCCTQGWGAYESISGATKFVKRQLTIYLSKNILTKFQNSFTRSFVEYEQISTSNGLDLTSFSNSHEEADTKNLSHSLQATLCGCNRLEVAALPGFVPFLDQTFLVDF